MVSMIQSVYDEVREQGKQQTKILTKVSAMEEHLRNSNDRLSCVEVKVGINDKKLYMAQGGIAVLGLVVTIFIVSSYLL